VVAAVVQAASAMVAKETDFVRGAMRHAAVPLEEYTEAWGAVKRDLIYLPSQQAYGRAASATNSDRSARALWACPTHVVLLRSSTALCCLHCWLLCCCTAATKRIACVACAPTLQPMPWQLLFIWSLIESGALPLFSTGGAAAHGCAGLPPRALLVSLPYCTLVHVNAVRGCCGPEWPVGCEVVSGGAVAGCRLDSVRKEYEVARGEMEREARRASKVDEKVKVVLGGLWGRDSALTKATTDLHAQLASARVSPLPVSCCLAAGGGHVCGAAVLLLLLAVAGSAGSVCLLRLLMMPLLMMMVLQRRLLPADDASWCLLLLPPAACCCCLLLLAAAASCCLLLLPAAAACCCCSLLPAAAASGVPRAAARTC
jgi:hypothetical protein